VTRQILFVVAKQPAAGRTKTRLCPPLTYETAAQLYACFLQDTLTTIRAVADVERVIAFLPADAELFFHTLAADMRCVAQQGNDLGERLDLLLTNGLESGANHVVVMSSDCPTLPPAYITQAFAALDGGVDVVLGPSDDGGYYLIGITNPQPRLLREVQMSTPSVLADTLAIAAELSLDVALLPPWYDVDTLAELDRLRAELRTQPIGSTKAAATRQFLAAFDA